MIVGIDNEPRPYAWGDRDGIAELLGRRASGRPEAELWLGAHPGSPSRILDPAATGGAANLAEWVATEPERALGRALAPARRLPFLLKVLAAAEPLSLQAHPTPQRARAGYERETAAGVPLDAPHRNYRDRFHKPELIVATSEEFEALCGFRPLAEARRVVEGLRGLTAPGAPGAGPLDEFARRLSGDLGMRRAVEWLLGGGDEIDALVAHVARLAETVVETSPGGSTRAPASSADAELNAALVTVHELDRVHPADPGVLVAMLTHRVRLRRGEALYLPAGNIHAYLRGVGIELMAASDNVLRGGLTSKHVDVPELLEVLDFRPLPVPYLEAEQRAPGVRAFRPEVPDFELVQLDLAAAPRLVVPIPGPAVVLATDGEGRLSGANGQVELTAGTAWYATPDERELAFEGRGQVFVAGVGEGFAVAPVA